MTTPVSYAIIHHGDSKPCDTKESCSKMVRIYQNTHMDENKWDDIAYSFVVGGDGNVYEGRGWSTVGAHSGVVSYNKNSQGL